MDAEAKKNRASNALVSYKVDELQKGQTRLETKVDVLNDTLLKITTIPPHEFDAYKQYVDNTYVKKESLSGLKAVGSAVAIALAVSVVFALAHLLGAKI